MILKKDPSKIIGVVEKGSAVGRKLGFPTINLSYNNKDLSFGVYACKVKTPFGIFKGAMHFGPRAVLKLQKPIIEVHLLDFNEDLYGEEVEIEIIKKIRGTKKFKTLELLQKQITIDIEHVNKIFKK